MVAIRQALPTDFVAVSGLLQDWSLPTQDLTPSHFAQFLVLAGGEVFGCVGIELLGTAGLLRSLALRDQVRGYGWGARLVAALEQQAAARGVADLFLLTTTAATFFESQGYRHIERAAVPVQVLATTEFSSLCPSSSACLFKSLSPSIQR
jgi:amino-acid N-acetyltransferase